MVPFNQFVRPGSGCGKGNSRRGKVSSEGGISFKISNESGCMVVSPFNAFAQAITDHDCDGVHAEGHCDEKKTCRRGVDVKVLCWTRGPVEHLNRHDGERGFQPLKGQKREVGG